MSNEQFVNALSDGFRAAAATHLGATWELCAIPPDSRDGLTSGTDTVTIAARFEGGLDGCLYICPDEAVSRAVFANADATVSDDFPAAWLNLVQSFATQITEAFSTQRGEVKLASCSQEKLQDQVALVGLLRLGGEVSPDGTIALYGDAALFKSLEGGGAATPAAEVKRLSEEGGNTAGSFDRVMDVPLAVTLRFGKRQLTLRELLELNMGSLVELDRQVEEPVDLMLGERIIARGEVVIVDGNYGMRVTEVIEQPSRRAAQMQ